MAAMGDQVNMDATPLWRDEEGAGLIRTLCKVWRHDAPPALAQLLSTFLRRGLLPTTLDFAASKRTRALAVAHLLPAMLRWATHNIRLIIIACYG